ncbi:ABC transporter permease [Actinoplanes flavus]|uniref:ABC transporter permease n=1 Tax=Actinoplanes flavus TaxID=2820290 RepID=A0ABS3UDF5_9ACTN|nr:ABC transporter permease [Actinoplanes flavus]MBO3736812.1 ABC transporter permease [Actinoplanes flavus]
MTAVWQAALAGARRRRSQSLVVFVVVLLSAATTLLAAALLIASDAPFDRAFTRQNGAHLNAVFAPSATVFDDPAVTAKAGPYPVVEATLSKGRQQRPPGVVAGRSEQSPAVDRLELTAGRWLTGPGQIVLSPITAGTTWKVGDRVTVRDVDVEVVGIASSVTATAAAWVWPGQTDVLGGAEQQLLYRLADPSVTPDLPGLTGSTRYQLVKLQVEGRLKPMVPFVVAFAVLGLVMSTLIVVNVVAGAVVAGYRVIGVRKALGFTPGQVVAAYAGQILLIAVPACVLGVAGGRLLSIPLLAGANTAYTVIAAPTVPWWADVLVLAGLTLLTGLAAAGPALRAGRLSATRAITVGRAPRGGHGFRIRRALAALPLPRPITFGLASPFTRPARTAVTMVAILLGVTTVVFAAGLSTSLTELAAAGNRVEQAPVLVAVVGRPPREEAVRALIEAQPKTAAVTAARETEARVPGSGLPLRIRAYDGDASWTGYPLLSGRWYAEPGEAVAGARLLSSFGVRVGDELTVDTPGGRTTVRIVGEAFSNGSTAVMIMDAAGLGGSLVWHGFEVSVTPGTDPHAYAETLNTALGEAGHAQVSADSQENEVVTAMLALIATLTLLLTAVAGLGVLNTVVLETRERVHEIGVLKTLGMTPGQVRLMVISSMLLIGAVGGALAVPLGRLLHAWSLPIMGEAAGLTLPPAVLAVYRPAELVALGAAGILLAAIGALLPAGWAARSRASTALRAE